ncbi:acyl-CoA thioesterase/bile acid-CoA:amino acid N-acyltransferase family protein [Streptococcus sobrinus]|uniref:acyl-CoA thioesterase/bile acid-CoA:amino acid N-acyltransferase family protein n=2 Tax=Streptococcus sobrinus TaxID=1310 RepID=UPI00031C3734|nr:acyl-CoA thioester hydrolase/BAAT C-terminal domain-containing protein [Streptococcus sobrinus]
MRIHLVSQDNLADSPFDIQISGLEANVTYLVRMTLVDYYNINAPMDLEATVPWQSQGIYTADELGQISVNKTYCQTGSYQGQVEMGLFFNSKPTENKRMSLQSNLSDIPLRDSFEIQVELLKNEEALEKARFKRYYQTPQIRHEELHFSKAQARLFYPEKAKNLPAIIVLSGSDGRIEKAQNIAQILASRGFVTMAVAYFGLEGLPKDLDRIDLDSIEKALSYLACLPQVDGERIGIYGRSKGAELALLAVSFFPELKCLVVNSPSCAVLEGMKGYRNSGHSSWTYRGKELPYTKFSFKDFIMSKLLRRPQIHYQTDSYIPVEKIQGHLFLIGAEKDEIWPTYESIEKIEERWKRRGTSAYKLKKLILKSSGHMLTLAYQPNSRYKKLAWKGVLADSVKSWQATVEFFKRYL